MANLVIRKLTQSEIKDLEEIVDSVRACGGVNVKTRDIHDHRMGYLQDSYKRSYSQTSTAKAIQKAGHYGYLDVHWDGQTFRATIPKSE